MIKLKKESLANASEKYIIYTANPFGKSYISDTNELNKKYFIAEEIKKTLKAEFKSDINEISDVFITHQIRNKMISTFIYPTILTHSLSEYEKLVLFEFEKIISEIDEIAIPIDFLINDTLILNTNVVNTLFLKQNIATALLLRKTFFKFLNTSKKRISIYYSDKTEYLLYNALSCNSINYTSNTVLESLSARNGTEDYMFYKTIVINKRTYLAIDTNCSYTRVDIEGLWHSVKNQFDGIIVPKSSQEYYFINNMNLETIIQNYEFTHFFYQERISIGEEV